MVLDAADGGDASVFVRVGAPRRLQALGPLTAGDVHHITLSLARVDGPSEVERGRVALTLGEWGRPVNVRHMRSRATYRLRAQAFGAPGDEPSSLLSERDAVASAIWRVEDSAVLPPVSLQVALRPVARLLLTTLVGDGTSGDTNGAALRARLEAPAGLAVGTGGQVYVTEPSAHRIRVLSPEGELRTLTGGSPGYEDGPLAAARFRNPTGLAVDGQGVLYVADTGNRCIRRIPPAGAVETLTPVGIDATGLGSPAASFVEPVGLAVGSNGDLWVSDAGSNGIFRVASTGEVSLVAGGASGDSDGGGSGAGFRRPQGLACAPEGTVFVADTGNHRIRAVTPAGSVSTLAGGAEGLLDGFADGARFRAPSWLALDPAGQLYVADTGNHCLRRVAPTGYVFTLIGAGAGRRDGGRDEARLNSPAGLGLDGAFRLFVVDGRNHALRLLQ
ncbi:MAG: hypothetical protein VKQ33_16180 [Candidatus Sericytochromatia bacterium]|nr:hypothetical protein [Candidatus Sericytochromatia bacterium]